MSAGIINSGELGSTSGDASSIGWRVTPRWFARLPIKKGSVVMRMSRIVSSGIRVVLLGMFGWLLASPVFGVPEVGAGDVLQVPKDFATIQEAVDAAGLGDIIRVAGGTFSENVLIEDATDLRLYGSKTVLQGGGVGFGIHLLNSSEIRVQGFIVDGYELGVLLENTADSQVHNVETLNNDSPDSPMLRDGLALWNSNGNEITNVDAHDNGHNGISLRFGSIGNHLQGNSTNDNGQNATVAASFGGCGIQLIGPGNNDNHIVANEADGNGWGIQIGPGSNDNHVLQNRAEGNQRAGVVVLDATGTGGAAGVDNIIGQNNAKGNGLANVGPSGTFDLFDQGIEDNIWKNNQGTFNH
jgi:parallel beta-helix repeat protein